MRRLGEEVGLHAPVVFSVSKPISLSVVINVNNCSFFDNMLKLEKYLITSH